MTIELWSFDKFWVIWSSCIEQEKTLKEIQNIWKYEGNSLYQAGRENAIWKEMVNEGFLENRGNIEKRGVSGTLLYSRFEWIGRFMKDYSIQQKTKLNNELVYELIEAIDSKNLASFFDKNRSVFFSIERIKILFGNSKTLRKESEKIIFIPVMIIINAMIADIMENEMGIGSDSAFLLSQPVIFTPCTNINFFNYYKAVKNDLEIGKYIIDRRKIFKIWMDYTNKLSE